MPQGLGTYKNPGRPPNKSKPGQPKPPGNPKRKPPKPPKRK